MPRALYYRAAGRSYPTPAGALAETDDWVFDPERWDGGNGGEHKDWRAEYFLLSRCQWDPAQLFTPIVQRALP